MGRIPGARGGVFLRLALGGEDGAEKADKFPGGAGAGIDDFGVGEGLSGHACGPVGEAREGARFDPEGAGLDGFEHGGHSDGIGPERAHHADFGRRFVLRPEHPGVYAFAQRDAETFCGQSETRAEAGRIGFGHVHEMRDAEQRGGAGEVEVVREHHPAAGREGGVDGARRVGEDEAGDAELAKQADASSDGGGGVSLVEVDAALGDEHADAAERSGDETAGMSLDLGDGQTGEIGVGDRNGVLEGLGECAETGAKNERPFSACLAQGGREGDGHGGGWCDRPGCREREPEGSVVTGPGGISARWGVQFSLSTRRRVAASMRSMRSLREGSSARIFWKRAL